MDETELLRTLHPIWINRTSQALARGAGIREDLKEQLERFYELLTEAVDTGNPSWLDSILSEWSTAPTETELLNGQSTITPFLREIMQQTWDVCRETLDSQQALDLTTATLPFFTYAFEKACYLESKVRVDYVSNQLKQAQTTLERLDRSKSDFIAIAAHELRTPLTLIEGYTAMLRESTNPNSMTEMNKQLLNGINTGTSRLKTIIDDMIDVSLIDNNLLQLNFQPIWIDRLMQLLTNELQSAAAERHQKVTIKDFPGSHEMTFADPERLLQVLRNVLTNAIKYTPDGGRITVEGRKLPGFVEIVVSDTGIGINPEDQGIIFNKFTRLGNSSLHSTGRTKFKGGGPGLGLHIARGIIEAHGGAIWVESPGYDEKTNPGSTFHILLPLLSKPPDSNMARLLYPLVTDHPLEANDQ